MTQETAFLAALRAWRSSTPADRRPSTSTDRNGAIQVCVDTGRAAVPWARPSWCRRRSRRRPRKKTATPTPKPTEKPTAAPTWPTPRADREAYRNDRCRLRPRRRSHRRRPSHRRRIVTSSTAAARSPRSSTRRAWSTVPAGTDLRRADTSTAAPISELRQDPSTLVDRGHGVVPSDATFADAVGRRDGRELVGRDGDRGPARPQRARRDRHRGDRDGRLGRDPRGDLALRVLRGASARPAPGARCGRRRIRTVGGGRARPSGSTPSSA